MTEVITVSMNQQCKSQIALYLWNVTWMSLGCRLHKNRPKMASCIVMASALPCIALTRAIPRQPNHPIPAAHRIALTGALCVHSDDEPDVSGGELSKTYHIQESCKAIDQNSPIKPNVNRQ